MEPRGPDEPAFVVRADATRNHRVRMDRIARRVVMAGGLTIIASILAIFVVIGAEVYPLLKSPTVTSLPTIEAAAETPPILIGVDEYREVAFLVTEKTLEFVALHGDSDRVEWAADDRSGDLSAALGEAKVVGQTSAGRGQLALGLSDGRVLYVAVHFEASQDVNGRRVTTDLSVSKPILMGDEAFPIRVLAYQETSDGPITAAATGPKEVTMAAVRESRALIGESKREEIRQTLALTTDGQVTALALDERGENLFVGTSAGRIAVVDLSELDNPTVRGDISATRRAEDGIAVLGFLIGHRTLVVGDTAGTVSSWQLLRSDSGDFELTKIYDFEPHTEAVRGFSASARDKGFVTADASGLLLLHYGTTGRTLLSVPSNTDDLRAVAMAPRADGLVAAAADGRVYQWSVDNPHPEISLQSMFGKVWYEGYDEPTYVWQSTGGTDDFEGKFSLTPLIFGTLKGTLYALAFSVPISLLAALYASQFMHPDLKRIVKPTVEIMAALPSVVLGFIAGLWLAPVIERIVPGVFLLPLVVPIGILLALLVWQFTPDPIRRRFRHGTELLLLVPVVCLGAAFSFFLGELAESSLLEGDYRNWLLERFAIAYDQRNSLVVGFAMGFAVIPIIFTIADDSLSNVPQHLTAGSLALGATRWQTAVRVILPTASPGIFSAVMIGFGRAVGETMIVLMATGNTPVMDWSLFNGFRALSATIAVELPEAPAGATLYRVLFLAALLLFALTFVVNTIAELVRIRLRKKYRYL